MGVKSTSAQKTTRPHTPTDAERMNAREEFLARALEEHRRLRQEVEKLISRVLKK